MKFLNPFTPHIAVNGLGQYLVRVYSFVDNPIGWSYYDRMDADNVWSSTNSVDRWWHMHKWRSKEAS